MLENFYFTNKKPVLLLVDKKKSYDKSFKGDFNFSNYQTVSREKNNNYIFTGAQIIDRSIFSEVHEKIFSMNFIFSSLFIFLSDNLLIASLTISVTNSLGSELYASRVVWNKSIIKIK